MERTFIMLKPGVLQRRIAGEIISRIEKKGLQITAMKMTKLDRSVVKEHYAEHLEQKWYSDVEDFVVSGAVIPMVVEGPKAIMLMRKLCGGTFVEKAEPGTIRGDFALGSINPNNVIHASDSPESAEREISIFFDENEIHKWEDPYKGWA
ncbi:MAG: nucleoside-diphosphate kinase [Spirochaetaceae bacterium]|nr:nucleoside-diphosphate kinase [Spirochaetaceae bacterium]